MKCVKCQVEKQDTEFGFRKGKKRTRCFKCDAKYHKDWYYKHRHRRREKQRLRNIKERAESKRKIEEIKSNSPCTDCRLYYDPVCMDFDHLRDKKHNVSDMKHRSWKEVLKEISKCEIVCANCHRIRTKTRSSTHP
jgi:hypothetical protein